MAICHRFDSLRATDHENLEACFTVALGRIDDPNESTTAFAITCAVFFLILLERWRSRCQYPYPHPTLSVPVRDRAE